MNIAPTVAELQQENVIQELECIDRMYINAYVRRLTSANGVAAYFRGFLGHRFASTKSAGDKTDAFVRKIMEFVQDEKVDLVRFVKGVRKDEVMKGYAQLLLRGSKTEGPQRRRHLEAIDRGADRIDKLVNDLLEVSRFQLGKAQMDMTALRLDSLACPLQRAADGAAR